MKKYKIIGIIIFISILFIGIINLDFEKESKDCNDIYRGVCFDNSSIYYKSDMINKECNQETYEIIKYLREK